MIASEYSQHHAAALEKKLQDKENPEHAQDKGALEENKEASEVKDKEFTENQDEQAVGDQMK